MRTRMETLKASDKPGNFSIEIPGKGLHHFRLPTPSQAQRIADFWQARGTSETARVYEQAGIVIGLAWRHESIEFVAQYPSLDPTDAALVAYSEAIQVELEEEGYDVVEIGRLGTEITRRMNARIFEAVEARKLAGFTAPPKDS